jgi:hypothetical protein
MKSSGKRVAKLAVIFCSVAVAVTAGRILLVHKTAHAATGTEATRSSVDLTIYSDDFGMVHETRPQQVSQGDNHLHITDVSKQLDPQSVSLGWKGEGAVPQVVAQAYDLGVNSESDLTKRYVGHEVELVRYGQNGLEAGRQKGELMVQGDGGVVLQSEGSLYVNPPGTIVAPASNDIVTIPQLSVQADSPSAQKADLDMTYLTRGISWSADYVATISPTDDSISFECWATVLNKTGVDYPNAHVSLVTGSPNRAAVKAEDREEEKAMNGGLAETATRHKGGDTLLDHSGTMARMSVAAPISMGEFHAYPVTKPTSIIQEQMNRILMFSSKSVTVVKDYNTRPPDISAYDDEYNWGQPHGTRRGAVALSMTFFNNAKNGLGEPLPHGDIRLYAPAADGSVAYVGAASVIDTPENERVDVTPGTAFDLFTEWRTVKRERVAKHLITKTVELKLHNEKAVNVKLRVVQGFEGRFKIVDEPIKHSNLSSSEAQWIVPVNAHSTYNFTFKVQLND